MDAFSNRPKRHPAALAEEVPPCAREMESRQILLCLEVVAGRRLVASTADEADVFRLAAQLVSTNFPQQSMALDRAATAYFTQSGNNPRSFPKTVADGLIMDVPRLRNLLERALQGIPSW